MTRPEHSLAKKRNLDYRRRRDRVINSFFEKPFSNKEVANRLKLEQHQVRDLLEKMCDDGDIEKISGCKGSTSHYRARGNANYWLKVKWRTST